MLCLIKLLPIDSICFPSTRDFEAIELRRWRERLGDFIIINMIRKILFVRYFFGISKKTKRIAEHEGKSFSISLFLLRS